MKPYRPLSRSSTVYEYLIPIDLAQSSDAPAAVQIVNRRNYLNEFLDNIKEFGVLTRVQ